MTKEYQKESTLKKLYWNEEKSLSEIGEMYGVGGSAINHWMERHDIPKRDVHHHQKKRGGISISSGYAIYSIKINGDTKTVRMNRLNALLGHSIKELKNNVVHHKNHVKWDNRPKNLEVLSHQEHNDRHFDPW